MTTAPERDQQIDYHSLNRKTLVGLKTAQERLPHLSLVCLLGFDWLKTKPKPVHPVCRLFEELLVNLRHYKVLFCLLRKESFVNRLVLSGWTTVVLLNLNEAYSPEFRHREDFPTDSV